MRKIILEGKDTKIKNIIAGQEWTLFMFDRFPRIHFIFNGHKKEERVSLTMI